MTTRRDALLAADLGADAIGLVFAESPRQVTVEQAREIVEALPPFVTAVGVFVDELMPSLLEAIAQSGVKAVQLHGDEPPDALVNLPVPAIKAFRVRTSFDLEPMAQYHHAVAFLLDARVEGQYGGTGHAFEWTLAQEAKRFKKPIVLSGGLRPENVADAIRTARPYAVDVSTGVESRPGRKDPEKLRAFFAAVRDADG